MIDRLMAMVSVEETGIGFKILLLLLAAIIVPILLLRRWLSPSRNLPPSPPGLPIIGHLHLLGTLAHRDLAVLARKYGPLMYMRLGTKNTLVVSSPEMAKELFKTQDLTFSHRPELIVTDLLITTKQGMAFQANNASWRNLRKIFTLEIMSPKRLQASEHMRAKEVDYMLNSIFCDAIKHPNTPVKINTKLWLLLSNFVSRLVLNKRYFIPQGDKESEEVKHFKEVMNENFFLLGSIFPGDGLPFLKPFDIGGFQKRTKILVPKMQGILTQILSERRELREKEGEAHVDVDMVDVLLTQQARGGKEPITEGNIRGLLWDAFAGGTDTQVAVSEWVMANLLRNPKVMECLKQEIDNMVGLERKVTESDLPKLKYLQAVVKETFRLHPPVPLLIPHQSHHACTVAGYDVPPNTQLFVNIWAMGRDERIWEDPLEFRPERFMEGPLQELDVSGKYYELMPFGTGRRICPALSMGLTNVEMCIASLIQAFQWSLPEGVQPKDIDMMETLQLTIPMATPLLAIPKPRLPAHLY